MIFNSTCPNCGRALVLRLGSSADSAPWLCSLPAGCGRSWWRTELGDHGRTAWDARSGSHQNDDKLQGERIAEVVTGQRFGFNVRPSEVASLTDADRNTVFNQLGVAAADQNAVLGVLRQMESGALSPEGTRSALAALGYASLGLRMKAALGG